MSDGVLRVTGCELRVASYGFQGTRCLDVLLKPELWTLTPDFYLET